MAAGDGYNNAFRWDCCSEGKWDNAFTYGRDMGTNKALTAQSTCYNSRPIVIASLQIALQGTQYLGRQGHPLSLCSTSSHKDVCKFLSRALINHGLSALKGAAPPPTNSTHNSRSAFSVRKLSRPICSILYLIAVQRSWYTLQFTFVSAVCT